eukprot:TRINITY_DN193_c2_g2_i1.p1 TRINITY_DN193_c2_g2~~TRINITY_DN193_c2_g2_i1.p1  ORF type:complete len:4348 (+),score=1167.20 TRINITY_DN193_c2_g2_i1:633-13046(+)
MTRWYVCYRKTATRNSGMRTLPWQYDMEHGGVPPKWQHLGVYYSPVVEPSPQPFVPGLYGIDVAWESTGYPPDVRWHMNDTREYTWGALTIEMTNFSESQQLDTRPWNLQRDYGPAGGADAVEQTVGCSVRLVRRSKPCDYPGFEGSIYQGANSTDGGAPECNHGKAEWDRQHCMGSAANDKAVPVAAFYITVPERAPEGYRVCFRLGAWNWQQIAPSRDWTRRDDWFPPTNPDGHPWDYLLVEPNPITSGQITLENVEDRSGMEALFVVSDTQYGLSAAPRRWCHRYACDDSGDVLRLVPAGEQCDINPTTWKAQAHLADTHLSLHCRSAAPGSGTAALSGLSDGAQPCSTLPPVKDWLCSGKSCSTATTLEREYLSAAVSSQPDLYDDIVPYDQEYYQARSVAAVITVPPWVEGDQLANRYRVCYKQMGKANWLIFNQTWEVNPSPAIAITYPFDPVLLGGQLQRFDILLPTAVTTVENPAVLPTLVPEFYAKLVEVMPNTSTTKDKDNKPTIGVKLWGGGVTFQDDPTLVQVGNNDNCLNPPGGTEGDPFASATRKFRVIPDGNRRLRFHIIAPHNPGKYWLCIQVRRTAQDSMSWWRAPTPYSVVDNGIRWYVTQGNEPINRGLSTVSLVRCTPRPGRMCELGSNFEVFNTTQGGDAAKIIATSDACHGAPPGDPLFLSVDHGNSFHAAVEGGVFRMNERGVTDLGPADGPADVAEAEMTMPTPRVAGQSADVPVEYKVCVLTTFRVGLFDRKVWVEVEQVRSNFPGLSRILDVSSRFPAFVTRASTIQGWTIDAVLQPNNNIMSGASLAGHPVTVGTSAVGLAGASTIYVMDSDTGTPKTGNTHGGKGFKVMMYAGADTKYVGGGADLFKLVLAGRPTTRQPPLTNNGTGWMWTFVPGASCADPAVDTASNFGTCSAPAAGASGECPSISPLVTPTATTGNPQEYITVTIHLPIDAGMYLVCFKNVHEKLPAQPWLMLPDTVSGSPFLFTVPTYLEYDATDVTNLTVYDLKTASSTDGSKVEPVSSWCTSPAELSDTGVKCRTANSAGDPLAITGFYTDLLTIVNDTQVCRRPEAPTRWAIPPTNWFNLIRVANATTRVWDTWTAEPGYPAFGLPPSRITPTGRYKICVYKAGQANNWGGGGIPGDIWLAKQGVIYQLYNRIEGHGFWTDNVRVTHLIVTPEIAYNSTVRFTTVPQSDYVQVRQLFSGVDPQTLTEPLSGMLSHTPVVRSGVPITVLVRPGQSSGAAVPYGSFAVFVEKCDLPLAADNWEDIRCLNPTDGDVSKQFLLQNVVGRCGTSEGPQYGWGPNGLRQFLDGGALLFRLQFRSACRRVDSAADPNQMNHFGCGLRFSALPSGQTEVVHSDPMWINVEEHWPDALELDGKEVEPNLPPVEAGKPSLCSAESKTCFLKECFHDRPCVLRIQARWNGPAEFAPKGRLNVEYSALDYGNASASLASFQADSFPELRTRGWMQGGYFDYSTRPKLASGVDEAFVYINITFALNLDGTVRGYPANYVRTVIRVVRIQPSAFRGYEVTAMDVSGRLSSPQRKSTPVLVWEPQPSPGDAFLRPASLLTAMPGAYIEALVPYELRYEVCTTTDSPCTEPLRADSQGALDGWTLTASIRGQPLNGVLHAFAGLNGTLSKLNLLSSPTYATNTITAAEPGNMGSGPVFRQWFRVRNNLGCSRFNSDPGCTVEFLFQKGSTQFAINLRTPVRVVAQGLRVEGLGGGPPDTARTVREGIAVTVVPGASLGEGGDEQWLTDEYHYGDMFALIDSPAPTDGVYNRDRVTTFRGDIIATASSAACAFEGSAGQCLVWRYAPQKLDNRWAARWVVRPNKPCFSCVFTFHSTWGAGPESFTANFYGIETFTFTDDTKGIGCTVGAAALDGVGMPDGSPVSASFDISVEPVNEGGTNTGWPTWWVFIDTLRDVMEGDQLFTALQLRRTGETGSILSTRMAGNSTTAAVFSGLYFQGPQPESDQHQLRLTFHSVQTEYDATLPGAVESNKVRRTCSASITLTRQPAVVPVRHMEVVQVDGATAMCSQTAGCTDWYTTTSGGAVSFTINFFNDTNGQIDPDTTDRNLTAQIPAGQAAVLWTCPDTSSPCSTEDTKMRSPDEDEARFTAQDGFTVYTYGVATVKLQRALDKGNSAAGGKGTVTIEQQGSAATKAPVKGATFSICPSYIVGGQEVVDTRSGWRANHPCIDMRLWIIADGAQKRNEIFAFNPQNVLELKPGTNQCGTSATVIDVSIITYFTIGSDPTRYIVYDTPIRYSLAVNSATQGGVTQDPNLLAPAADTTITDTLLTTTNAVPKGQSRAASLAGTYEPRGFFSFSALYETSIATQMTITALNLDIPDEVIRDVVTPSFFKWKAPTENYVTFNVLDQVEDDDECPSKRYLATSVSNYRSYAPKPGKGWSYSTAGGVAAGLQFPIQAVVKTSTVNPPGRSWTFKQSLVSLRKRLWTGCNDGGTLTLWQLKGSRIADTKVMMPTSSQPIAFTEAPVPGAVYTHQGMATLWPVLSDPCQNCVLELSLCYTSATSALDCLLTPETDLNGAPSFAERTKFTRPFSVERQQPNSMHLTGQTLPIGLPTGEIGVGQYFTVDSELVQRFGEWSLRSAATDVKLSLYVVNRWAHADPQDAENAALMQYGNGGFLSTGLLTQDRAAGDCLGGVNPVDIGNATRRGALITDASSRLTFFFTRPCSRCQVWFYYELRSNVVNTTATVLGSGSFPLRDYAITNGVWGPGAVRYFTVRTCGAQWILAGIPPVAVRRGRPFSITVWRADRNYIPSWTGASRATLAFTEVGGGNGGGGEMAATSPLSGPYEVRGSNGSVTVRLQVARACFACRISLAQETHTFTVLTDPTQIIVVPEAKHFTSLQHFTASGDVGRWQFQLYAADELGDRSYTVAGPTMLNWRPLYSQRRLSTARLSVEPYQGQRYTAASVIKDPDDQWRPLRLSDGSAMVTVTNGSWVYNGVPWPELEDPNTTLDAGTAVVETHTLPVVSFPVSFAIEGLAPMQTRQFGELLPPTVDWTVRGDRIALDTGEIIGIQQGEIRTIRVFAIGKEPGALESSDVYYRSVAPSTARVRAVVDCTAGCVGCRLQQPVVQSVRDIPSPQSFLTSFERGVATFQLSFSIVGAPSGTCMLTVTAGDGTNATLPNAAPQNVPVEVTQMSVSKWAWASSTTFAPGGEPSWAAVTAKAAATRVYVLALRAWDTDFKDYSDVAGVTWDDPPAALVLTSHPTGCFVCVQTDPLTGETQTLRPADGCRPSVQGTAANPQESVDGLAPYGARVEITGVFPMPDGSTKCDITDISGLPAGTALSQPMTVTVQRPVRIELATYPLMGLEMSNFSGMVGRTEFGEPAMVTGRPAFLTLRVVDAEGKLANGDFHTRFVLQGYRIVPPGTTLAADAQTHLRLEQTAAAGEARITLGGAQPLGPTQVACTPDGACQHAPWELNVTASYDGVIFDDIKAIGPLYVIIQAEKLRVEYQPQGADWRPLRDVRTLGDPTGDYSELDLRSTPHWIWGYPFRMRLTALDSTDETRAECTSVRSAAACALLGPACRWETTADRQACRDTGLESALVPRFSGGVGGSASVLFRPVALPCYSTDVQRARIGDQEDQPWIRLTCIEGGECANIDNEPECGFNGWGLGAGNSTGHELELRNGGLTVDTVVYTGETAKGRAREGRVRFMLSTTDFGGGAVEPYIFLGQLVIQRHFRITFANGSTSCESASDGSATVCSLPVAVTVPNVTRNNGSALAGMPRIAQKSGFDLTLQLLDVDGRLIQADNVSVIHVNSTCSDTIWAPSFYLGEIEDQQLCDTNKELCTVTVARPGWADAQITEGVAKFRNLGFHSPCPNATLIFSCVAPESRDPTKSCDGKIMSTVTFEVGDTDVDTPSPPTPIPDDGPLETIDLPRAVLDLGPIGLEGFGNLDRVRFEETMGQALIRQTSRMLAVYMRWLCDVSKASAQGGGIPDKAKRDPTRCRRFQVLRTGQLRRAQQLQGCTADDCSTLAEFEVELVLTPGQTNLNLDASWQQELFQATAAVIGDPTSQIRLIYKQMDPEIVFRIQAVATPTPVPDGGTISPDALAPSDGNGTGGNTTGGQGTLAPGSGPDVAGSARQRPLLRLALLLAAALLALSSLH